MPRQHAHGKYGRPRQERILRVTEDTMYLKW